MTPSLSHAIDAAGWPMTLAMAAVFVLVFVLEMILAQRVVFWILVLLDRLLNALAWGDPRETVSARAARARRLGKRWGCLLCKALERIDPGHCRESGVEPPTPALVLLARRLHTVVSRAAKGLKAALSKSPK